MHVVELTISTLAGLGCLILLIFCATLICTHLYLISVNLTTNEYINYTKYDYLFKDGKFMNPFNRGIFSNCYTFWFRPDRACTISEQHACTSGFK
jgi:hypothetical protein